MRCAPAAAGPLVLMLLMMQLASGGAAHAQQARAAVVPETITVGDVFHAAVRVDLPPGARLVVPDDLDLPQDVESAGRHEISVDTAGGGRQATVAYPLAAWRPGEYELPPVTLSVISDGEETSFEVDLPSFAVRSVLPADTAGVAPRAAKDVLGANRVWWPILLLLLLAVIAAIALYLWWRSRRRAAVQAPVHVIAPREAALARLQALRADGLLERGEVKLFYETLTETLRHYAAAVDPSWSVDLTTSELSVRLRRDLPTRDALELVRILGAADFVKFAQARPPASVAADDLDAGANWVERVGVREQSDEAPAPDERRVA